METAVIEFLFSALAQLAAQYPDAAWLAVALSAVMTVCGLCAVAIPSGCPCPRERRGRMPPCTAGPMPLPRISGRTGARWRTADPKPCRPKSKP